MSPDPSSRSESNVKTGDRTGSLIRLTPDRVVALTTAAIAVVAFVGTYSFARVPAALMGGLGAVEFPRLVAVALLVLGILLLLGDAPAAKQPPMSRLSWAVMAACVGFLLLVPLIGMLASMLVFLAGVAWLWGERRLRRLLGTAVFMTAAIWAVFENLLQVKLPPGMIVQALFQ